MSLVPYDDSDDDQGEVAEAHNEEDDHIVLDQVNKKDKCVQGADKVVYTSLGIVQSEPIQGDWLCFVFLPLPLESDVVDLLRKCSRFLSRKELPIGLSSDSAVQQVEEPHISLTRPILLRRHECDALLPIVKEALQTFRKGLFGSVQRLVIAFSQFALLPSEDAKRSYWTAELGQGWDRIQSLTAELDRVLKSKLHSRKYHDQARFHTSFAFVDAQPANDAHDPIKSTVQQLEQRYGTRLRACSAISINQIGITIGPKTYYLDL
jgi:Uncharacterised conserved protein